MFRSKTSIPSQLSLSQIPESFEMTNTFIQALMVGAISSSSSLPIPAAHVLAMTNVAPVQVDRCAILPPLRPNKSGTGTAWFTVVFRNTSNSPADTVTMRVDDLGVDRTIIDKGTFSPGIEINHEFTTRLRVASGPERSSTCQIVAVHFQDGSEWTPSRGVSSL